MKTLSIFALGLFATLALVAISGPADSSQSVATCGQSFEIRDPELRVLFAKQERNGDFAQLCTVNRASLSGQRVAGQ